MMNPFLLYGISEDSCPWRPWWKIKITDKSYTNIEVSKHINWIRYNMYRPLDRVYFSNQAHCERFDWEPVDWSTFKVDLYEIDRLDKMRPMASPPLVLGQVWYDMSTGSAMMIDSQLQLAQGRDSIHGVHDRHEDLCLVYGPHSPWASFDWVAKNLDKL